MIKYKIIYKDYKEQMSKQTQSLQFASFEQPKDSNQLQMSTVNQSIITNPQPPRREHRKYGNMVVLFQNDRFLITLGPDYWCFATAMICFLFLYYFTITTILATQRQVLAIFTIVGSIVQVFSYIMIAISNPGIITKADFDTENQQQPQKIRRFCNVCNLPMLPRSRHCSTCGVCVKGYDHHCPWTSKCIGQHNLFRFYFFAAFTPLFLVFCIIMLSIG